MRRSAVLVESVVRMAGVVLPAQDRPPPPGQLPEFGNSSPVGLVVVLLLLLATVFLIRGMSKRIKRLPESFDAPADGEPADGERAPGPDGADARVLDDRAADDRAEPRGG